MVSIIIPVYNAEFYLENCIKSILKQTYPEFEILCVDDGSTDSSGQICDTLAQIDCRIQVAHTDNFGVAHARNIGLEMAKGEYISFCDADDEMEPDYLEKMVCAIERYGGDIAICSYYHKKNDELKWICPKIPDGPIDIEKVCEYIFLRNDIGGFVWNKMFRKRLIKELWFNEKKDICEDTFFLCQALLKASSVSYINVPLYRYNVHSDSAVNRMENLIDQNHQLKYATVYNNILSECPFEETIRNYIRCGIFMRAVSAKCNYQIFHGRDKIFIKNLFMEIRKNMKLFLQCKKITMKRKIITMANLILNIRRLKVLILKYCVVGRSTERSRYGKL